MRFLTVAFFSVVSIAPMGASHAATLPLANAQVLDGVVNIYATTDSGSFGVVALDLAPLMLGGAATFVALDPFGTRVAIELDLSMTGGPLEASAMIGLLQVPVRLRVDSLSYRFPASGDPNPSVDVHPFGSTLRVESATVNLSGSLTVGESFTHFQVSALDCMVLASRPPCFWSNTFVQATRVDMHSISLSPFVDKHVLSEGNLDFFLEAALELNSLAFVPEPQPCLLLAILGAFASAWRFRFLLASNGC